MGVLSRSLYNLGTFYIAQFSYSFDSIVYITLLFMFNLFKFLQT